MSRTADLRKLIKSRLDMVQGGTYYVHAPDSAEFPYKTFELSTIAMGDLSRFDYAVTVDVWDNAPDPKEVEEIADELEEMLSAANLPQDHILPTFFRESRYIVEDPDKDIQHLQMNFSVQLYKH